MATRIEKLSLAVSVAALFLSPVSSHYFSVKEINYQMKKEQRIKEGSGIRIQLESPINESYDLSKRIVSCMAIVTLINSSEETQFIQQIEPGFGIKEEGSWGSYSVSQSVFHHGISATLQGGKPVNGDTKIKLEPNELVRIYVKAWRSVSPSEASIVMRLGHDRNGEEIKISPLDTIYFGGKSFHQLEKFEKHLVLYYLTSTFSGKTIFIGSL